MSASDAAFDAASAGLLSDVSPPPTGGGSPEVLEGEINLKQPFGGPTIGSIFAQKTDPVDALFAEQWVFYAFSPTTTPSAAFDLQYNACATPGCGNFTATRLNGFKAAETTAGTDYKLSSQLVEYRVFPSTAVAGLPVGLPTNSTASTFTIASIQATTNNDAAFLYRIVRNYAGYQVWTDHWVLTDKYALVGPSASASATANPTQYTDLKAYMVAMQALFNASTNQGAWRYVQVSYGWRDL